MTKELEALERIRKIKINGGFDTIDYFPIHKEDLDIIEAALKKQDSIEITAIDIEQDNKELCKENKKLKRVLEIIKESIPIEEEDFFYDKETDTYFFIGNKVSKDQYSLLKEELL